MKKYFLGVLIVILLVFVLNSITFAEINQWTWTTSKGTFELSERIAKKVANGEKLIFRASIFSPGSPLFVPVEQGFRDAAVNLGIDMKMIGPPDAVVEKQIAELETIISAEMIDGLAIATMDVGSTMPMFEKAWKAGIPIISWDLDSPEAMRLCYVGPPNYYKVGILGGKAFTQFYPAKTGKLALFAAFPEATYARGNIQRFLDVLWANEYKMTTIGPFKLTIDKAFGYGVVENAFLANPDIAGVYVADEYCVVVAQYLERNNLQDKVVLIGKNDMEDILAYVKKGVIKQTVGTEPYKQGLMITQVLYDFVTTGKTYPDPYETELGSITIENVDEYLSR